MLLIYANKYEYLFAYITKKELVVLEKILYNILSLIDI